MSIHVRETGKGRRYDVKLRDRGGVMHTKTFRTKREAVDFEADQRSQLSAGTFIAPRVSATTVEDLATRWLAAGTKRDSSRARDRSIVQTHLLPGLGPRRAIGTVTRADCQALVDRWVAAGLAPRTVIRVAAAQLPHHHLVHSARQTPDVNALRTFSCASRHGPLDEQRARRESYHEKGRA